MVFATERLKGAQLSMKRIVSIVLVVMMMLVSAATAEGLTSITTGLPTDKDATTMVVQLDNQPGARPQKGIGSADIVYEIELYRGGATRYTAVFNDNIPEEVEAVRSTRIVNAMVFSEYGGAFVYYGARTVEGNSAISFMNSKEFKKAIGSSARFNGIWVGCNDNNCNTEGANKFYRDGHRVAPHNVIAKLQELAALTDWAEITCDSPLKFRSKFKVPSGEDVTSFAIDYGSRSYAPSYVWDPSINRYQRLYNNKPFTDGATGEQIYVDNVIVQHVRSSWHNNSSEGPVVEMVDENVCDYFVGGKHFIGTWKRDKLTRNTVYFDENGKKVKLNPGVTYIQIFKDGEGNQIVY